MPAIPELCIAPPFAALLFSNESFEPLSAYIYKDEPASLSTAPPHLPALFPSKETVPPFAAIIFIVELPVL